MNRLLYLALIFIVIATSCSRLSEVNVMNVEVRSFQLLSTSKANLELECLVQNPSNKDLVLESADALLKKGGIDFATATLVSADTIPPKTQNLYRAVFLIDIKDPLALLAMGLNISKWSYSDFRIDAKAVVKASGGAKRTIKFKDVMLKDLINRL